MTWAWRRTPYPGGAPANVAAALGKLGLDVSFVSAIGKDDLAKQMLELLASKQHQHHASPSGRALIPLSMCLQVLPPGIVSCKCHACDMDGLLSCSNLRIEARLLVGEKVPEDQRNLIPDICSHMNLWQNGCSINDNCGQGVMATCMPQWKGTIDSAAQFMQYLNPKLQNVPFANFQAHGAKSAC